MNTTTEGTGSGLVPEHIIDSMKASHGAKMLKESPVGKYFSDSPMADAFFTVLGPVVDWFSNPSNSVAALVCMVLAPFIAWLILPLFIILIPALIFFGAAGVTSSSVRQNPT